MRHKPRGYDNMVWLLIEYEKFIEVWTFIFILSPQL